MGDAVSSIIVISVVGSYICSLLNIEGRMYRYVSYVVSLVIISMLISPVYSFMRYLGNAENYLDLNYEKYIPEKSAEGIGMVLNETDKELRQSISNLAKLKFDILLPSENIIIEYDDSDKENVDITKIKLNIENISIIKNLNEFCLYISEIFLCSCEVM